MFVNDVALTEVKRYDFGDELMVYVCEAASALAAASRTCLKVGEVASALAAANRTFLRSREDSALAASSSGRHSLLLSFFSVNKGVSRCKIPCSALLRTARSSALGRSRSGLSIPYGDDGSLCAMRAIASSGRVCMSICFFPSEKYVQGRSK